MGNRDVLVDNSSLSVNTLNQLINNDTVIPVPGYRAVLIANSPLLPGILAQVVARTPSKDPDHYNQVLASNGM
jgi:hypothetical protein